MGTDVGNACDNCPGNYNPAQEDSYPPQGNSIGDACDCEGDFTCDGDVDVQMLQLSSQTFGRSKILDPCTTGDPCNGDFLCDSDADGADASRFNQTLAGVK